MSNTLHLNVEEIDQNLEIKLTKKDDFESTINVPDADVLNLSGPRMGITFFSGEAADIHRAPLSKGGYDALPLLSQFGYQFDNIHWSQNDDLSSLEHKQCIRLLVRLWTLKNLQKL